MQVLFIALFKQLQFSLNKNNVIISKVTVSIYFILFSIVFIKLCTKFIVNITQNHVFLLCSWCCSELLLEVQWLILELYQKLENKNNSISNLTVSDDNTNIVLGKFSFKIRHYNFSRLGTSKGRICIADMFYVFCSVYPFVWLSIPYQVKVFGQ